MKKYILFDLDGTLVNTREGIVKCAYYALDSLNITEDEPEKLERLIGPPLSDSFRDYYNLNEHGVEKAIQKFRERYKSKGMFECSPYDGISDLLSELCADGRRLCVATSKLQYFAELILENHGLKKNFEVIVGSTEDESLVRKADIIQVVLSKIQPTHLDQVIMVGDRSHDIIGAKQCGIECIGIRHGFADPNELENAGADYVVDDVEELRTLLFMLISNKEHC